MGGIHGLPFEQWQGSGGTTAVPGASGGYCTHSSVLFPTWHRPYVALYEVRTTSRSLTHTTMILMKLYSNCFNSTLLTLPKSTKIKAGGYVQRRTFERLTGIGLLIASPLPRSSLWKTLTSSSPRVRGPCRTPCSNTNSTPSTRPSSNSHETPSTNPYPSTLMKQRSGIPRTSGAQTRNSRQKPTSRV